MTIYYGSFCVISCVLLQDILSQLEGGYTNTIKLKINKRMSIRATMIINHVSVSNIVQVFVCQGWHFSKL